jgi:hypothetical protein
MQKIIIEIQGQKWSLPSLLHSSGALLEKKKSIAKSYRDYKATDSTSTIPESLKNVQKNSNIVNDIQVE